MLAQPGQRTLVEAGVAYRVEMVRGWVNRKAGQLGGLAGAGCPGAPLPLLLN